MRLRQGFNNKVRACSRRPTFGLVLFGCFAASGAFVGCAKEEPAPEPIVARPVKTMVVAGDASGRMTFPGTTQGADRAVVAFRVSGELTQLPINEGDQLNRGDLIARVDPRDFEIAVSEAKAEYEKAEADRKRYQRLYEQEAVPLADLELARAKRDVARARFDQAETNLGYTYLRAPYSGRVGRKYVENHEYVQAQESIISLQNLDIIEIVVDVPEYLLASARERGPALYTARFDAIGSEEFALTFKEATAEADATTRTYQVTLQMPQPEESRILPGMTATVFVRPSDETEATFTTLVVPSSAVFADDTGAPHVWILDTATMTVSARAVTVGPVTGETGIRVDSGLNPGDTIVTTGASQLGEGYPVRFMEAVRKKGDD